MVLPLFWFGPARMSRPMLQSCFSWIRRSWINRRWLPLLFAAILGLTSGALSLSHRPALGQTAPEQITPVQPASQAQIRLSLGLTLVAIDAEIAPAAQTTQVSIRAIGSLLEEMDFQFPVIEFAAIEQAIAQELGLSTATIHRLIRYRINR